MLRHEIIRKQFLWGISVLSAYMKYNKTKHYKDINIFSEGFAKELLRFLYKGIIINHNKNRANLH